MPLWKNLLMFLSLPRFFCFISYLQFLKSASYCWLKRLSARGKKMLEEKLRPFLPDESLGQVVSWIHDHRISLTIAQKRNSLLGDYRPPAHSKGHRISVNGD